MIPTTDKDLWEQFHAMWGDAKAQRSYVKANWMALQSMIKNRLESVESEVKARHYDAIRERVYRMCQNAPQGDEDAMFVSRHVQPPATAEEAKAQRERVTEQANRWVYNVLGHVCPETSRVAMTVAQVIELQSKGDVYSFTYDPEAKLCGLDPWRLVDSINPFTREPKAELWFDNGGCREVGTDEILYVQQSKKRS